VLHQFSGHGLLQSGPNGKVLIFFELRTSRRIESMLFSNHRKFLKKNLFSKNLDLQQKIKIFFNFAKSVCLIHVVVALADALLA